MPQNKITTIIFDFWGVITQKWEIFSFLQQCEIKYNKSLEPIKNESKELWDNAVIGKMSSKLYWDLLGKYFNIDPEQLLKDCIELDWFRDDVFEIIKSLKWKYKLWLLTNIIKDWFIVVDKIHGFNWLFDIIQTSYEAWCAKPNEKIYYDILDKLESEAEECIFIDDKKSNVDAAQKIWINWILFTNPENLKKSLLEFLITI